MNNNIIDSFQTMLFVFRYGETLGIKIGPVAQRAGSQTMNTS